MRRRNVIVAAFVGSAIVAAAGLWLRSPAPPAAPSSVAAVADKPRHPTSLTSLVNHAGRPFSFEQLKGRTVALNFIFTHCPVSCPVQTKALTAVQRALPESAKERVQFVSISMDPARDTPPVLGKYASALGADLTNWSFVTGSPSDIASLIEYFNAQVKATDGGLFDHRIAVYLLDADQRLMQTYSGEPLDQKRLATEIETVDRLFNRS